MRVERDHQARESQNGDIDVRLSPMQKEKARRVVCGYATDKKGNKDLATGDRAQMVADANLLMTALGIHPDQIEEGSRLGPPQPMNNTHGGSLQ